jgi:octaprenyl-diphosphate synthase
MDDLLRYLENDLPQINAFIHSEISRLDPFIGEVAGHVMEAGGKRLRPALTLITARSLGVGPEVDLMPLACSLEFLHSATLMHDDILDGAVLRRGQQAAHLVYGTRETVLAGDVLLALANSLAASYGDARITQALAEAIMGTATGEVREIAKTRDTSLSLHDYLTIITEKTALLFQCACATGAMAASADNHLVDAAKAYGLNLGIAFQIVDDALDYAESPNTTGKPKAGDLREGKMTLPLIMLLETLPGNERTKLEGKIASGDLDDDDIRDVLAKVETGGFAQAARAQAAKYAETAKNALALFPENKEKNLMTTILDFVLNRNL